MRTPLQLTLILSSALFLLLAVGCPADDDDFAGDDDDNDDTGDDDTADDDDDTADDDDDTGDDDSGDDDTGDDDSGDDDTTLPDHSASGTVVPDLDLSVPIPQGSDLRVLAYAPENWDSGKNMPISMSLYEAVYNTTSVGSWPQVFMLPIADVGDYHILVHADPDSDQDISEGDSWGAGTTNPVHVDGHVTGVFVIIDSTVEL